MIPYIVIFILFFLGVFLDKEKAIVKNTYYIFLVVFAIIFAGLRDMIGGFDIYIYSEVYEATWEEIVLYSPFEQGFKFYFLLLKQFSDYREFMIFMTSFFMFILHSIVIKKNANNPFFSLLIYFCKFYLMSFVYLRQGLAMGVIWMSIPFILNRKFIPFLLLTILAFYFHKSSIIFFPLYFIANHNFSKKEYIIIPILTLIIAISPLSNMIFSYIGDEVDSKFGHYANKQSSFNIFYLIEASTLALLLYKFKSDLFKSKQGRLLANGLFIYILVTLMSITNATFIRFVWYYLIFVILILPLFYEFIKTSNDKFIFKSITLIYFITLSFRLLIIWDGGDLMPYQTIFSNESRNGIWDFMEYRNRKLIE